MLSAKERDLLSIFQGRARLNGENNKGMIRDRVARFTITLTEPTEDDCCEISYLDLLTPEQAGEADWRWRWGKGEEWGEGYDMDDSFIDNTMTQEEVLLPHWVTTERGGFYINHGTLEFAAVSPLGQWEEGEESDQCDIIVDSVQSTCLWPRQENNSTRTRSVQCARAAEPTDFQENTDNCKENTPKDVLRKKRKKPKSTGQKKKQAGEKTTKAVTNHRQHHEPATSSDKGDKTKTSCNCSWQITYDFSETTHAIAGISETTQVGMHDSSYDKTGMNNISCGKDGETMAILENDGKSDGTRGKDGKTDGTREKDGKTGGTHEKDGKTDGTQEKDEKTEGTLNLETHEKNDKSGGIHGKNSETDGAGVKDGKVEPTCNKKRVNLVKVGKLATTCEKNGKLKTIHKTNGKGDTKHKKGGRVKKDDKTEAACEQDGKTETSCETDSVTESTREKDEKTKSINHRDGKAEATRDKKCRSETTSKKDVKAQKDSKAKTSLEKNGNPESSCEKHDKPETTQTTCNSEKNGKPKITYEKNGKADTSLEKNGEPKSTCEKVGKVETRKRNGSDCQTDQHEVKAGSKSRTARGRSRSEKPNKKFASGEARLASTGSVDVPVPFLSFLASSSLSSEMTSPLSLVIGACRKKTRALSAPTVDHPPYPVPEARKLEDVIIIEVDSDTDVSCRAHDNTELTYGHCRRQEYNYPHFEKN